MLPITLGGGYYLHYNKEVAQTPTSCDLSPSQDSVTLTRFSRVTHRKGKVGVQFLLPPAIWFHGPGQPGAAFFFF